jgi:hypothetical protein
MGRKCHRKRISCLLGRVGGLENDIFGKSHGGRNTVGKVPDGLHHGAGVVILVRGGNGTNRRFSGTNPRWRITFSEPLAVCMTHGLGWFWVHRYMNCN